MTNSSITDTTYDEVPYESSPFPDTHPQVTAAVALLFGLRAAEIGRCRILELGCAGGGNLIPMAVSFPESRFVGIDLSARQIADGQAVVDRLGISNIDLRAASILDVTAEWGQFDYIICHGVYSWVPAAVQDKILAICSENLAANGVAYVSYNTYPGWHRRGVVRDIMRFHVTADAPARTQVHAAREFLEFLIESLPAKASVYSQILQEEAKLLRGRADSYVLHEQLEEFNEPLYFHEFAERAATHGLQYVSESAIGRQFVALPPEALQKIAAWSKNPIDYEQRLDFVRDQMFRRTLLCHQDVTLRQSPAVEALFELHLAIRGDMEPVSARPDLRSAAVEKFASPRGTAISVSDPVTKAALVILREAWPRVISFEDLRQSVSRRLAGDAGPHPDFGENTPWQRLAEPLLECVLSGLVWIYRSAPNVVWEAREQPVACPLARIEAAAGEKLVTCRTHSLVELGAVDRLILAWLDGTRTRQDIIELVTRAAATREIDFTPEPDGSVAPVDRESLSQLVEACLWRLAAARVLVG